MEPALIDAELEATAALQSLIDEAEAQQAPDPSLTGVRRKAAHLEAISSTDIDHLLELDEKFRRAIDTITANPIDLEHLGMLTPAELYDLMVEYLDQRDLKEMLEIRYKMIRAAIYAHIDEINRAEKINDPEHTPREIPVPKAGKKFVRQGGKAKATLDLDALAERLGKKRWVQIRKQVVVAAVAEHIEYHLDDEKLLALVNEDPKVMELIRECVVPGGYGTPSFHVRELK